jgi:SAM-dependent methyltransferase
MRRRARDNLPPEWTIILESQEPERKKLHPSHPFRGTKREAEAELARLVHAETGSRGRPPHAYLVRSGRLGSIERVVKRTLERILLRVLPLSTRMRIAVWLSRARLPFYNWWAFEVLSDLSESDPSGFHRFLWSHHAVYARTYDVAHRYGSERIKKSRHLLLRDIERAFESLGQTRMDVRSVLDVGCSVGHLLRHMETDVFTAATRFVGVDIDQAAIRQGIEHLRALRSRADLRVADLVGLDGALPAEMFDVVVCAGSLLYVDEADARAAVASMLRRCHRLLVLTGVAHPVVDNVLLEHSERRVSDRTFIHNLDEMVSSAGGQIILRRYEHEMVDGNTIYFVFAIPQHGSVDAPHGGRTH